MELETRLQELERRRIDEETQRQQEKERTEETVRAAQEARDAAEKEALVFRWVRHVVRHLQRRHVVSVEDDPRLKEDD